MQATNFGDELVAPLASLECRERMGARHDELRPGKRLEPGKVVKRARLSLILAVRQVLQNGLRLLGVGAPETM